MFQQMYCQIYKYDYNSVLEYDRKDGLKELSKEYVQNNTKTITCSVIIDEDKKTITISQKYIPKTGYPIDMFENYYYVKKEEREPQFGGNIYYAVDLPGKKYLEFLISPEGTLKCEECHEFNGCQKFKSYKNQ